MKIPTVSATVVLTAGLGVMPASMAQAGPEGLGVMIQVYDMPYEWSQYRMADIFAAGYSELWHPPTGLASDFSVGYDPFDRFNLGTPGNPTAYGTEAGFRATINSFQDAGVNFYLDVVLNHNGARSARDSRFAIDEGAWPGFFLPPDELVDAGGFEFKPAGATTNNWFDFNNNSGFGPDAPGFNETINSELVGLLDIQAASNYQMVRHPVDDVLPQFDYLTDGEGNRGVNGGFPFDGQGNPLADSRRIPEGNVFNCPNPSNARLYPDRDLQPMIVNNPSTGRNGGGTFTIYPYNAESPMEGDPVMENATGLLLRWSQWVLEEFDVDGFRLDAAKHSPTFFWDTFWDAWV
ncbi:MAG: hypothetical protein AAGB34_09370, partial [Planctomycetota bacterium]